MLEYIYKFLEYYLLTCEADRSPDEKLNMASFGLYAPFQYNNASTLLPAILIQIEPNGVVEQFTNKVQRLNIGMNIYTIKEMPNNLTSNEIMTADFLKELKILDKIFKILEGKNGKTIPTFDPEKDNYFIHSLHRTDIMVFDIINNNKVTRTTFNAMLTDFSAVNENNYVKEKIELLTNIEINYGI